MVLLYMFFHPDEFETRIIFTAVIERSTQTVVAAELGYVVGDIYTSATGAYCVSGCGTLQLACLGEVLRRAGLSFWDLGMTMKYKEEALQCFLLRRPQWLGLVKSRVRDPCAASFKEKLQAALLPLSNGVAATDLLLSPGYAGHTPVQCEESPGLMPKSQRKKLAKKVYLEQKRSLKRNESPAGETGGDFVMEAQQKKD
jgi:hypothetical protein